MRAILSTGSPLVPETFDFVYEAVKPDLRLSSITGGTDIIGCFAQGNPAAPVRRGEIQCLALGMQVEVFDDEGRPLPAGEPGELVCTAPFPSMPVGFWNDPDGAKYRGAFFERFPGAWHHGDWVERTAHGGLVVHGRSDAVLNPGGVRIGTAEIYRQVEQLDEVEESIVIGQDWEGDVRVVLFVRLRPGLGLDDALADRIRRQIRGNATPRHVPARILEVADIPRTRNGKIVELAVRDVVHGRPIRNREALANPEALELFAGRFPNSRREERWSFGQSGRLRHLGRIEPGGPEGVDGSRSGKRRWASSGSAPSGTGTKTTWWPSGKTCDLVRPWNNPRRDIDSALGAESSEIFVAVTGDGEARIVGSVMAGYDGHRGWVYYVAAHPEHRSRGLGGQLMRHAEAWLEGLGAPKVMLMIREENEGVRRFYEGLGYEVERRTVMSRRTVMGRWTAGSPPGETK